MSQKPTSITPGSEPASVTETDDISCMPIEKCFEELEQIVESLESQTTSLEQSISLFERGMKLSRRCSGELNRIERKIQVILENSRGDVQLKDFEGRNPESERD